MSEAATPADHGMSDEDVDRALRALRAEWEGLYLITRHTTMGWWATRHGPTGRILTADTLDQLRDAITSDHAAHTAAQS